MLNSSNFKSDVLQINPTKNHKQTYNILRTSNRKVLNKHNNLVFLLYINTSHLPILAPKGVCTKQEKTILDSSI